MDIHLYLRVSDPVFEAAQPPPQIGGLSFAN
jgi:hypothetical protein